MSPSNFSIRPPAWEGLEPAIPGWEVASKDIAFQIAKVVGSEGKFWAAKFGDVVSDRMFRLDEPDGRKFIFKILEDSEVCQSEEAEKASAWLASNKVPVVVASGQYRLPSGEVIVKMPYLEGRRVGLAVDELFAFGVSLAKLHKALRNVPHRERWRLRTAQRLKALSKTRQYIVSSGVELGPYPQRLLNLANDAELDFERSQWFTQPLHGDVNPGNVLILNNTPVFMDFEDTAHSVLPVEYEVLFAIERFVLVRVDNDLEASRLGKAFLHGYRSQIKTELQSVYIEPVQVLRSLALRSLMVLVNGELSGSKVLESEWKKFFFLEKMSRYRAEVILNIFKD
ncbi:MULTISPECIES: phosphotransferase [Thalassospira]|uniref:Aminoglycoside phosphotransferase domain-containing protein n=2 Tax=Thalassospira tepidiphila TaxID=393657 RepID=A0A853L518_9PROT|nr:MULTISPECIES: phosphotransferase [Thalassospira]MBE72361.1 hypothetical protein [Thalassospira sp.]MBO6577938.1 phosphotransferase [Thalassospira sp.]MBO6817240.1 phosphotransferase [Thalassospira sp.]NJB73915.1 Ser/Thr protein kinase RdoA (MazF antagonist) [Thalassospira tepidiphila]OAZ11922.1 hypothetical protein TH4_02260 [Thalassospira tepidiphila MCCC 1A03514]|tara:strand:+ start:186 stop:1205 length:1020 start_codon:yes stop_codon:yes gene_type:complete